MKAVLAAAALIGCNCRPVGPTPYEVESRAIYSLDADGEAYCTAFHVTNETWATAAHCTDLFGTGIVFTVDGHPVVDFERHPTDDVATLTVEGTRFYPDLDLGVNPRFGDKVHVIGFPWHGTVVHNIPLEGRVGRRFQGNRFEMSVHLDGGASGAPVMDEDGRVVGIGSSSYRGRPYAYAAGVSGLRALL